MPRPWRFLAGAFLIASLLVGLGVGPLHIGVGGIVESALSHVPFLHLNSPLDRIESAVLWQIRAPRVVLAALVGGMLAIAGASYQGVFRNPLADPYLLGVAGGAGLGATLAIAYTSSSQLVPPAAFVGAAAAVALTYAIGRSAGRARASVALVLAGVVVATFTAAVQTFVQQQNSQKLAGIYSWLLGGFATAGWHDVAVCVPYIAVSTIVLLLHRRVLDALSVGDEEAASLGVDVARVRVIVVVAATIGTAAAVSVSGLIAFVGIIVPHTIRLLVSTSYRAVIPLSLVVGAGFLTLADVLARTALSPQELPIGVVTAFFGAPFFAFVLARSR
ncbi:MAG: iron ABC transporter permease [Actinobacteria bacterium]|nr:iron ABC transporter permease [Actinomycetota bacterium]MBV8479546.1 iron ABC transporter permease [Actinomycetota bacterium]MBV8598534.1 iron ABC transporter permease [Actinomycetota bacterium]